WTPGGESNDIEDRRGESGGGGGFGGVGGGGVRGLPPGGHIGGGTLLLLVLFFLARGLFFTGGGATGPAPQQRPAAGARTDDKMVQFVSFVLDDVQHTWEQKLGAKYHHAKLVLFTGTTQSGCGFAQSATGPFYCPEDEKVYIDLSFYRELVDRF